MAEQYGSQPTPSENSKSATYPEYTPQCTDESLFVSFISAESPDGVQTINNITGEPFGELNLGGSELYQRRVGTKSEHIGECGFDNNATNRMEGRVDETGQRNKRLRSSPPEVAKKAKKIKINPQDDSQNEGQSGFNHLSEFLSNIQHLNDGNLSFELDVSYSAFKLKLDYSFN